MEGTAAEPLQQQQQQQGAQAPAAQGEPPAAAGGPVGGQQPAGLVSGEYRERSDLPDMPGYRLRHSLEGAHAGAAVTAVRFDRTGRRLASAGGDGTAAIWDVDSGTLLHRLTGHRGGISDVAWSPDGRYLATASDDTTLRVWDCASGACVRILEGGQDGGHTHFAFCCAFSAGSNLLASGGFDEVVVLWDVRQGTVVKTIPGHSDPVSGVAFNGEPGLGELVASCSFDGLARVWQAGTGRCQASLADRHNPALASVRFTPNGKYLLTVTMDSRLLLWDPATRKVKKTYSGHLNRCSCCQAAFVVHSPPSKYVACGSEDHHVYLWDLQTKQIAGILRGRPSADAPGGGHCAIVLSVDAALEPGRQLIASGGQAGDGSVKIWQHEGMAAAGSSGAAEEAARAAAVAADGAVPMDAS